MDEVAAAWTRQTQKKYTISADGVYSTVAALK
jgi:hypothetical protein